MTDEPPATCAQCHGPIPNPRRGKKHCSGACRAASSRAKRHMPARVGSVVAQSGGRTAVTLYFQASAESVRRLSPGDDIAVDIDTSGG